MALLHFQELSPDNYKITASDYFFPAKFRSNMFGIFIREVHHSTKAAAIFFKLHLIIHITFSVPEYGFPKTLLYYFAGLSNTNS